MSIIFPGNYVAHLNAYREQGVVALPGVEFYRAVGAVVLNPDNDGVTDVNGVLVAGDYAAQVLSPDLRQDDKPRKDKPLTVPAGSVVYRTAVSVASGWGDGRVSLDGIQTSGATQVIGFGPGTATAPVSFSGVVEGANITAVANELPAGTGGLGACPLDSAIDYEVLTANTDFRVYSKAQTNSTATNGGWAISNADAAAGRAGYILCEVCFVRQDVPVDYDELEQYLPYKIASNYPGY